MTRYRLATPGDVTKDGLDNNSYSGVDVSFLWREIALQVIAVLARHMLLFSRVISRSDSL